MSPFPIHFAIDLEPDGRLPGENDCSFDGAGVALERMASWRGKVEAATGAPAQFGWYLRMDRHIAGLYGDPCVIANRYKPLLDDAARAGDEIGLHIHANEKGPGGGWRANYADEGAVLKAIEDAFASYEAVFQRGCRSVRIGDMWTSKACMQKLAACGALYDLTMESGRRPQSMLSVYPGTDSKGWRPSMLGAPLAPFRPDEKAMPGFWMLPVASYPRQDFHNPRMLALTALTSVMTGFRRRRARQMLRPQDYYSPEQRKAWIDAALAEGEQPGFVFAIRNFADGEQIEQFLGVLMALARWRPLKFCAPGEYVRLAKV